MNRRDKRKRQKQKAASSHQAATERLIDYKNTAKKVVCEVDGKKTIIFYRVLQE